MCRCERLRRIGIVQIQPRKHELDHTDHTDHADQEYICPEISSSRTAVGVVHTDDLPDVRSLLSGILHEFQVMWPPKGVCTSCLGRGGTHLIPTCSEIYVHFILHINTKTFIIFREICGTSFTFSPVGLQRENESKKNCSKKRHPSHQPAWGC